MFNCFLHRPCCSDCWLPYLDALGAGLLKQFDGTRVSCPLPVTVVPGQIVTSGVTRQLVAQFLSRHCVLQGGTAKTEAGRRCEDRKTNNKAEKTKARRCILLNGDTSKGVMHVPPSYTAWWKDMAGNTISDVVLSTVMAGTKLQDRINTPNDKIFKVKLNEFIWNEFIPNTVNMVADLRIGLANGWIIIFTCPQRDISSIWCP